MFRSMYDIYDISYNEVNLRNVDSNNKDKLLSLRICSKSQDKLYVSLYPSP